MAPTVALTPKAFLTKEEVREAILVDYEEAERDDSEMDALYRMINWVCEAVENRVNIPVMQRTFIEYSDGGVESIFMTQLPVASVTSVVELGVTLTSNTDYIYDVGLGAIRRLLTGSSPSSSSTFSSGPGAIVVTYVAGYGTQTTSNGEVTAIVGVPEDFKLAAYVWLQHLWAKGPANFTPEQGRSTGSRAAIPYEVKEILISRPQGKHWIGMG